MIMEPFEAYRFYQSIKLHFENDTYDAVKYNYKTSAKPQSFWKRKDKFFFAKVGRKFNNVHDLVSYYVAYFVNDVKWIGEMLNDEAIYNQWLKKKQSLGYNFKQDLHKLSENAKTFDDLFVVHNNYPFLIDSYLKNEISLETVVVINNLVNFIKRFDKQITETIVWPELSRKIRKYGTFIEYDYEKMKKIIFEVFTS